MLMRKNESEGIPSVKKPVKDMTESSGMTEDIKEKGGIKSEAEAAAQDFMDAISANDPGALVDAFMALDMACDELSGEDEGEDEEEETEGEGEPKKSPKDLISIILAKKKPS